MIISLGRSFSTFAPDVCWMSFTTRTQLMLALLAEKATAGHVMHRRTDKVSQKTTKKTTSSVCRFHKAQ